MDPGVVAQQVQVSAYPDAYDRQLPSAQSLLASIGYDAGGILAPGMTLTKNATGKPEAIFTNEQAQAIADMAQGGGGVTIENLHFDLDITKLNSVNDIIMIFQGLEQKIKAAAGSTLTRRIG